MNPIRPLSDIVRAREASRSPSRREGRSIQVRSLNAFYGGKQALAGIDLDIQPGLVTAIIGPSGCGKSTLIRCLNRMHEVIRGRHCDGECADRRREHLRPGIEPVRIRRRIGMVFQKPNPFPDASVYENVVVRTAPERAERRRRAAIRRGRGASPCARRRCGTRSRTGCDDSGSAFRAGSSSGCASRAPSRSSPRCCSWTSPARRWTRSRR